MRGWNIMWYNCEGNFGGVAIVIAAAAIVIVAGCWEEVKRMCGVSNPSLQLLRHAFLIQIGRNCTIRLYQRDTCLVPAN